jgi:AcrR family transcriptional regulator
LKVRRTKTASRILEVSLDLFNRFGEPNVAPATIAAALSMSTGNLYYHYPSKAELINNLVEDYVESIGKILPAAQEVQSLDDAWFFLHTLFEHIGAYQFLYRDLSDLLSKNHLLEKKIQTLIAKKNNALEQMLSNLVRYQAMDMPRDDAAIMATSMTALMTYWLSFEYIQNPRQALDPTHAQNNLSNGALHVLNLLSPYLRDAQRKHLKTLIAVYRSN